MSRALRVASYAVVAWCFVLFFYGLASFPDAPYKVCNSTYGYCGKTGHPHTTEEYEAQHTWERALLISWPFGILAAIYLVRTRRSVAVSK